MGVFLRDYHSLVRQRSVHTSTGRAQSRKTEFSKHAPSPGVHATIRARIVAVGVSSAERNARPSLSACFKKTARLASTRMVLSYSGCGLVLGSFTVCMHVVDLESSEPARSN